MADAGLCLFDAMRVRKVVIIQHAIAWATGVKSASRCRARDNHAALARAQAVPSEVMGAVIREQNASGFAFTSWT